MNLLKLLLRWTLIVAFILGVSLSPVIILHFILKATAKSSPAPVTTNTSALRAQDVNSSGLPMRLMIPKIGVDAALDYVGITSAGELGTPAGPSNAAWYDQGPRPGEKGNAVIDGHFGYKNHIPAVFDNLHSLQKGDNLYVVDSKGLTSTFVVRGLKTYGPNEYAPAVFRSSDGKAHLNLITCQGNWSQAQKSYSNRLVVFADKKA